MKIHKCLGCKGEYIEDSGPDPYPTQPVVGYCYGCLVKKIPVYRVIVFCAFLVCVALCLFGFTLGGILISNFITTPTTNLALGVVSAYLNVHVNWSLSRRLFNVVASDKLLLEVIVEFTGFTPYFERRKHE